MTLQEYYELQAKLKLLDSTMLTMETVMDDVRTTFNNIDPTQLGVGTPGAQPSMPTAGPVPGPVPVANPKQRSKLSAPILTGPLKDSVEDILTEKAEAAAAAAGPVRIAPYEVLVKDVKIGGSGNDFWASVYDQKYKEEAMVPVSKSTFDEFTRDSDGLLIDLDGQTLGKTEWLPVQEPTAAAVAATTEN